MNKNMLLKKLFFVFLIFLAWQSTLAKAELDFDGDGKTDPTVVRSENGKWVWYISRSRDGFFGFQWGQNVSGIEDQFVPEDYDGDGKWDIAIWRRHTFEEGQSYFYIFYSQTNTFAVIPWGLKDDRPVSQDYDGDGKADIAVYRASDGTYYIQQSRDGFRAEKWGKSGDEPLRGDYDGDGKADLAVYRRDSQTYRADLTFYIKRSSDGTQIGEKFGYQQADFAVPGDYDGDGKTDIAVWRGRSEYGNGTWYWHRSSDGRYEQIQWGLTFTPDYAVQGDYDGDGKTDVAVYRSGTPPQSIFYINGSRNGFMAIPWGSTDDSSIIRFR
jgi:hypothetical protein